MSLGQFLGNAGAGAASWQQAEEAQRIARQNQLAIEEQNRVADMQKRLAAFRAQPQIQVPQFSQGLPPGANIPYESAPVPAATPASQVGGGRGTVNPPLIGQPQPTQAAPAAAAVPAAPTTRPLTPDEIRQGQNRLALLRAPTAALDVVQAPIAAGLNLGGAAVYGAQNLIGRGMNYMFGTNLPTDVQAPQRSMTPFYDTLVRQGEQRLASGVTEVAAPAKPAAPATPAAPAQIDMARLNAAVEKVESGGRADAVSPKGARGPMQTMPGTLVDPGFGVAPAQDRSTEELRRVGQDYLSAMLRKYNGNLDHALAAYNWGPGNTDKWIAAGADPAKLPKETREYIPKVKAALGGTTTTAAPAQPLEVPKTKARLMEMAEYNLANPESIPYELQQLNDFAQQRAALLTQQRNERAQLAEIYMQSGTTSGIASADRLRREVEDFDIGLLELQQQVVQKQTYLQGMQGLRELATANDSRRLASVLTQLMGVPVGFQPRSDGTYNHFVNGRKVADGVSVAELANMAMLAFDPEARAAVAKQAATESELAAKAKYDTSISVAMINAEAKIREAIINGEYKVADRLAASVGLKVQALGDGSRFAVIKDNEQLFLVDPSSAREEKTAAGTITIPPRLTPIR